MKGEWPASYTQLLVLRTRQSQRIIVYWAAERGPKDIFVNEQPQNGCAGLSLGNGYSS